jgi:mono/diheme cytochrome c family protein
MKPLSPSRFVIVVLAVVGIAAVISADLNADDAKSDEWKAPARAARRKNPIPADDRSIAIGKDVYEHQCLSCHGQHGHGDGPAAKDLNPKPRDLADPKITAQTDGELFWKITEGKKPMPSFETLINEEQRWHVINYVRSIAPPPTSKQGQ